LLDWRVAILPVWAGRRRAVITGFLMGAVVGGAAVWFYGTQMRQYLDDKTRTARSRAADTLQAAAETLQSAKDTVEGGLGGKERRAG
jgi:hypothetical protein